MVTEVKLVQNAKHDDPKLVTDDGMVIEVKLLQPEKLLAPSSVTGYFFPSHVMLAGITISFCVYLLLVSTAQLWSV